MNDRTTILFLYTTRLDDIVVLEQYVSQFGREGKNYFFNFCKKTGQIFMMTILRFEIHALCFLFAFDSLQIHFFPTGKLDIIIFCFNLSIIRILVKIYFHKLSGFLQSVQICITRGLIPGHGLIPNSQVWGLGVRC